VFVVRGKCGRVPDGVASVLADVDRRPALARHQQHSDNSSVQHRNDFRMLHHLVRTTAISKGIKPRAGRAQTKRSSA